MSIEKQKVFCVGWHKTGTSTLGEALIRLGYNVVGARLDTAELLIDGKVKEVIEIARDFDAFQDVPWAALYKELDRAYPGSKFILTERDEQKWLNSASNHFGDSYSRMREWLYGEGVLAGNEQLYLERYRRHNHEVKDYFKNREADFLIMDFEAGDGWEKLCTFLGVRVPKSRFPHSNKGKHSYTTRDKIINGIKLIIPGRIRRLLFKLKMELLKPFGYTDPRDKFNNLSQNNAARKSNNNQRSVEK